MHNIEFKGFTCFKVQGTNLNFGWGSIQEWGCIQADTVFQFLKEKFENRIRANIVPLLITTPDQTLYVH